VQPDSPVDLRDTPPFKERLEAELRVAALQLEAQSAVPAPTKPLLQFPRLPVLAFACFTLLLVAVGVMVTRPSQTTPVAAEIFIIERTTANVTVQVIDVVADLEAAQAELDAAGLDVKLLMVPVSPSLEGHLVRATGDENATFTSRDGRVAAFTLTGASTATLSLAFGRAAEQGEMYEGSWEPHVCEAVRVASNPAVDAEELGYGDIIWRTVAGESIAATSAEELITAGVGLVVIEPIGPGQLLIVLDTEGSETPAPCR
jgi:hypothetical protein